MKLSVVIVAYLKTGIFSGNYAIETETNGAFLGPCKDEPWKADYWTAGLHKK